MASIPWSLGPRDAQKNDEKAHLIDRANHQVNATRAATFALENMI
jgi:hypothetical protein